MKVRLTVVVMLALLASGCATWGSAPLSAADMEKKCNKEEAEDFWTDDCLTWKHKRDDEERAKEKAEAKANAAEWKAQQEQQAKQREEQVRKEEQAIRADARKGYKYITFEDFALDGHKLEGAKVAIRGFYYDQAGRFFRDQISVGRWIEMGDVSRGTSLPLMTERANRSARAVFLRCANPDMPLGCGMVIRGRVRMMTLQNRLGVTWRELGIAVDSIRR